MQLKWHKAYEAAVNIAGRNRIAVRLTNLSIAAVAAHRQGLIPPLWDPSYRGSLLRSALKEVALLPLPPLGGDESEWDLLAEAATDAAMHALQKGGFDEWVATSQAADPERKTKGAYATPSVLAEKLVILTIGPAEDWTRPPRIIDPSAGAGALLLAAYRYLIASLTRVNPLEVLYNLHGVELDGDARELCCLHLWIAAANAKPSLSRIAENIIVSNAITRNWWDTGFRPFDVLLMNPPWESLRLPVETGEIASDVRCNTAIRLDQMAPGADGLPPLYTAQGRGDRNLYKAFLELAPHLLALGGRLGALIPAAFASDDGMALLRGRYFEQISIEQWTGFENLRGLFPIDSRYKFGLLIGERSNQGTGSFAVRSFATEPRHADSEHIIMSRNELRQIGGPQLIIPELNSIEEKRLLAHVLSYGTSFFDGGDLGRVRYRREVDLTLGRLNGLFHRFESYEGALVLEDGGIITLKGEKLFPLIEGRMVGQYDFYQKSWQSGQGRTAKWIQDERRPLSECRPQFVAAPMSPELSRLAICDITSATNTRTVHATWVPPGWPCGNTAPVLVYEDNRLALAALAVLNSLTFDWVARRIVAGLHLNKFYLERMVWPRLSEQAIDRLAGAASALCSLNPRFKHVAGWSPQGDISLMRTTDLVSLHVIIEQEVARGYDIRRAGLRKMFDAGKSDRRGFWRYYASVPTSSHVVAMLVND